MFPWVYYMDVVVAVFLPACVLFERRAGEGLGKKQDEPFFYYNFVIHYSNSVLK